MITFSMAAASGANEEQRSFETLELGVPCFGYSNGASYQDYRFFQVDM
jgi:hypothetical protein